MTADATSSSIAVYIASVVALWGIAWCHDSFKDSKKCRDVMTQARFFDLVDICNDEKSKPEEAEKMAECMRCIFRGWPNTVSEMVHDDETTHGTLFRCLVSAGSIIMYGAEWGTLSPGANLWPVLSQLRAIMTFFGVFGIAFAPLAKRLTGNEYRDMVRRALERGRFTEEEYESKRIAGAQDQLHALVALTVFFFCPLLEAIAIGVGFWTMATATDRDAYVTVSAMLWAVIQLVRVFLMYSILVHLTYFPKHMSLAVVKGTMHNYKCFSSEYSLVISFCFLMVLLGVGSFFDPRTTWTDQPVRMTAKMAVAAWHIYIIVPYTYNRLRVCVWNNLEYTTDELVTIFKVWKEREMKKRDEFEAANQGLVKLKARIDMDDESRIDMDVESEEMGSNRRWHALKNAIVVAGMLKKNLNEDEHVKLVKMRSQSIIQKKSK